MTSEIEQYMVYLAEATWKKGCCPGKQDAVGNVRSLFANFSYGATNLSVPAETNRSDYTYWLVYTLSSLIEQTTPAELLIFDSNGTVDAPFFVGQDLNLDNLEGTLQWTPQAVQIRLVGADAKYPGWSSYACGNQPAPLDAASIESEGRLSFSNALTRGSQTHFLVYARSSLAEQTTPAFIKFADAAALFQARDLFFSDGDLDEGEIAGNLSWAEPSVIGDVTFFRVYFSTTGTTQSGDTTSLLEEVDAPRRKTQGITALGLAHVVHRNHDMVGLTDKVIAPDTPLQSYVYLAVTSNSPSIEQRTPSTWLIYDEVASAANVSFVDLDLDETQLGGTIKWDPPARTVAVSAPLSASAQGWRTEKHPPPHVMFQEVRLVRGLTLWHTGSQKSHVPSNLWKLSNPIYPPSTCLS
ncbi:unnamed protein product [Symbiodinium natans]|uniref:Uncharacterized protein n=1 Tax=Symbiodinium natans TaxID=878477 RepID=A0A812G9J5_9DINO|nr:unnamed protein product [Symbiodinium natans]